ncbi:hypothetical protein FM110_11800 [Brachybacterium nesterenkovii]|uniref:Uncharacterized protein n=1 Tax=Brachybacterium nesterenkovii TaxID=47847 RepID=A0A1X6X873_9MICO|nr:hypothetical protein FM110_11800 [Brachybacterium nesterenkovii]
MPGLHAITPSPATSTRASGDVWATRRARSSPRASAALG